MADPGATHDLVVLYRGDGPRVFRFPVQNGVGPKADLTDATWRLYAYGDPATPVLTKTLGDGIEIPTPATDGIIRLTLGKADVLGLSPSVVYEGHCRATDAAGAEITVSLGPWLVRDVPT